ncbi:MAG TPA: hypothetical protein ENK11_02465 [Phycisphaerales bacterium]|nr:hypothetical protein [Phycisphaerales bacterium]
MQPRKNEPALTWPMLLGRWVEFARSAVSLPETGEAGRYRRSVAPLITLHAVTHALAELDLLPPEDRPPAIDRAEILIEQSETGLREIWGDPPPEITAFIDDARAAIVTRAHCVTAEPGRPAVLEWTVRANRAVFPHPGEILDALAPVAPTARLHVPTPGVPFFRGAVAACLEAGTSAGDQAIEHIAALVSAFLGPDAEGPAAADQPRQVYRQFDFARGGPVRDVIAPMSATGTPGQPLLVPGLLDGRVQPVPLPPRMNEDLGILPVVGADGADGVDADGA